MGLTLPRSPTEQQEYAYYWWVNWLHNRDCDHCGGQLDISHIYTSLRGVYCSKLCWHMEEQTLAWREGLLGHDSGVSR